MEPEVKIAEAVVTIPAPEVVAEKAELPTVAELKEAGMPEAEVKMAEKSGLIAKPEDKKPEEKKPEPPKEEPKTAPPVNKFEIEDDPVKEQEKLKDYNDNEKGLYFNMKKDRERRKVAVAERDHLLLKQRVAEKEIEDLRKQLAAKPKEDDPFGLLEDEVKKDDKPLTRTDLEVIEKEKADKESRESETRLSQAKVLKAKLDEQEVSARAIYSDFDAVTDHANDILKNGPEIFKDNPKMLAKAVKMAHDFSFAVQNADKFGETDYNATDIAYELGKLHPKYNANGSGKPSEKNNGNSEQGGILTPEKIQKLEQNSKLRSSASVNGGGSSETVSESDLSPEQAAQLSRSQWLALKPETRKRILSM